MKKWVGILLLCLACLLAGVSVTRILNDNLEPRPTLFIIDVEWLEPRLTPGHWWFTYSLDGRIYAGHFRCEDTLTDFITYLKSIANLWQSAYCYYTE